MSELIISDYQISGSGQTTIYLLHGAYGSKVYWQHQIKLMAIS
jgi:3-oxoadipate enol-lactonase